MFFRIDFVRKNDVRVDLFGYYLGLVWEYLDIEIHWMFLIVGILIIVVE